MKTKYTASEKYLVLSKNVLLNLLKYDRKSGLLFWKTTSRNAKKGNIAGTLSKHNGYRIIQLGKKLYPIHRIIWFLEKQKWPSSIDHINGNRSDNRIENLRECTQRENCINKKNAQGWSSFWNILKK